MSMANLRCPDLTPTVDNVPPLYDSYTIRFPVNANSVASDSLIHRQARNKWKIILMCTSVTTVRLHRVMVADIVEADDKIRIILHISTLITDIALSVFSVGLPCDVLCGSISL